MICFLFLTLISSVIFYIGVKKGRIAFTGTWIYVPAGIYAFVAVLSAVFAKNTAVALCGYPDRYEGLFVILGYLLVFVITLNVAQRKDALKLILAGLFFSAFIASLIGLFQFIGKIEMFGVSCEPLDFFKTDTGRALITPVEYRDLLDLNFRFAAHTICSTLYNTNYVGSFMEMTLMLSIVLFIFETNKTWKVVFYILSMFIFSNWLGCLSRGGYLGVIAATFILTAIAIFRLILSKKENRGGGIRPVLKNTAVIVSSFVVLFLILDFSSEKTVSRQFSRLNVKAEGKSAIYASTAPAAETTDINDASTDDITDVRITADTIYYSTLNADMQIKMNSNNLEFHKGDGSQLMLLFNELEDAYRFNDPNYANYKFRLDKNNIISLFYGKAFILVAITGEGFKFFDPRSGFTDMKKAASWGFEGMERMANIRGYLWSRTIPLLKDRVFLGNGPDTFALYFPQQDYLAKLKYYDTPYVIIDKPHNMYLQIAVNTGVVSLACILIIFISYVFISIRAIFTNCGRSLYFTVSLGAFLGNTAYMVTALFNDSIISVAPVFWIMLGMGYAANFVLIRENKGRRERHDPVN